MTTFALHTLGKSSVAPAMSSVAVVDSWRINVPNQDWVVERVVQDAIEGRGGTVFTINLDHLAKLRSDAAFRAAYERATYISADGMPVVALARSEGVAIDRVTGADLVEPLSHAAAAAGVPVYFFGTRADILQRAVDRLTREIPGLKIAGIDAPAMGFDPDGEAARVAAERISASGAGICFVALGAPKQELFANSALTWSTGVVYLGVGAALDFLAGERSRAPRFMQRIGLEWLWRTAQEPRRMIPRYLKSGLWLIGYVLRLVLGITRDVAVPVEVAVDPCPAPVRTPPTVVPRTQEGGR